MVASGQDLQFRPETNDAIEVGAQVQWHLVRHQRRAVPPAVPQLPAEHVQRPQLRGPEHQQLLDELERRQDTDNNPRTGVCNGETRAGVRDQGFELEAFTRPLPDLSINGGVTMSDTTLSDQSRLGEWAADYERSVPAAGTAHLERAEVDRHWIGSVDATIGSAGLRGLLYADVPLHERVQHRLRPRYREDCRGRSRSSMPASACTARTTAGRSSSGPRTCSTRTSCRWRSIRRCRAAVRLAGAEAGFYSPIPNTATQLYSAFLGEPRTFGVTLRGRIGFHRGQRLLLRAAAATAPPSWSSNPLLRRLRHRHRRLLQRSGGERG